jgi:hypothetical protein
MSSRNRFSLVCLLLVFCAALVFAQDTNSSAPLPTPETPQAAKPTPAELQVKPAEPQAPAATFEQVLDRVVEREHLFVAQMKHLHPMVETYIQNMKDDKEYGELPVSDKYFLGRLDLSDGMDDVSFIGQPGFGQKFTTKLTSLYSMHFLPNGFAQMALLDNDLQRKYYNFKFVRREFLGEVRCLVIDVQPKAHVGDGRFLGRIWVEDQQYNIVRFNGTYSPHPKYSYYLHFDSWRLNLKTGVWLPAYVYSEESNLKYRIGQRLHFKAQTRLWGYNLQKLNRSDEFTQIVVDAPQAVQDQSEVAQDATPVQAQRQWEHQAEENALERLQNVGLLAPAGDVDKVLQTVVNNLEVTNNISIEPEIHCRVLLTTPLESFTIGHTIVISRGMVDVLPDEASLAMVLSHELAHITLGHRLDTKLAFNDRMFFPDDETFERLGFHHSPDEEDAADKKAMDLLNNSPYKDKLATAGLFLHVLEDRSGELRNLIRPHLGDGMANPKNVRMAELVNGAPKLDLNRTDQVAALPLGGRVKMDPWSNKIELIKAKPVPLISAREKMPFEVTPFYPFLTRMEADKPPAAEKVASGAPGQ